MEHSGLLEDLSGARGRCALQQALCSLLPAGLFSDLDTHSHLGVISYGVSMTTLEDVYLKLEVEAEIDQAGGTAHGTFLISLVFGMLSVSGAVSHGRWEEVCCRGRS